MRRWWVVMLSVTIFGCWVGMVMPCGVEYTFRAYLDKRFWQPLSKYEKALEKANGEKAMTSSNPTTAEKTVAPFAGMASEPGNEVVQEMREAYRANSYGLARSAVEVALQGQLTEPEKEEVQLVEAKIDMREGEDGDSVLLQRARGKFQAFLGTSRSPALRSEARGWLARVHYLLNEYSSAAKIYLDELDEQESIFSHASLVQSLRMLFPYNGSSSRLTEHLEEYFDTPAHALFVVNIVTNPIYHDIHERAEMAKVARKTIAILLQHRKLFASGPASEALALSLMRAALYMGDTKSALAYGQWLPKEAAFATSPEYYWMRASCLFLQRQFAEAEEPLLKMYNSDQASNRDRKVATQALVGVYSKLGRPVEQLRAAFLYHKANDAGRKVPATEEPTGGYVFDDDYFGFMYWPACGWLLDLPYLLDVQLTELELQQYLSSQGQEAKQVDLESGGKSRNAYEAVEYALAVRYARRENFAEAAEIYERLGVLPRADSMRQLARLYAATKDTERSPAETLEARYAYASFLEGHSTQIFFNDKLWSGFQTMAFMGRRSEYYDPYEFQRFPVANDIQGLTRQERGTYTEKERNLKDEQEERWRAYHVLSGVVDAAGRSELGKRAALKALRCLSWINQERFGRVEEIEAARSRLTEWLRENKKKRSGAG